MPTYTKTTESLMAIAVKKWQAAAILYVLILGGVLFGLLYVLAKWLRVI